MWIVLEDGVEMIPIAPDYIFTIETGGGGERIVIMRRRWLEAGGNDFHVLARADTEETAKAIFDLIVSLIAKNETVVRADDVALRVKRAFGKGGQDYRDVVERQNREAEIINETIEAAMRRTAVATAIADATQDGMVITKGGTSEDDTGFDVSMASGYAVWPCIVKPVTGLAIENNSGFGLRFAATMNEARCMVLTVTADPNAKGSPRLQAGMRSAKDAATMGLGAKASQGATCHHEGCSEPATAMACARVAGRDEVDAYCYRHADAVVNEHEWKYICICPGCGCRFGVG